MTKLLYFHWENGRSICFVQTNTEFSFKIRVWPRWRLKSDPRHNPPYPFGNDHADTSRLSNPNPTPTLPSAIALKESSDTQSSKSWACKYFGIYWQREGERSRTWPSELWMLSAFGFHIITSSCCPVSVPIVKGSHLTSFFPVDQNPICPTNNLICNLTSQNESILAVPFLSCLGPWFQ